MSLLGKNRILHGKTKYKHSNRKWRDREAETKRGKNVKSHGYLKNVDSVKRKKMGPNCLSYGNPTDNPPGYDRLLTS